MLKSTISFSLWEWNFWQTKYLKAKPRQDRALYIFVTQMYKMWDDWDFWMIGDTDALPDVQGTRTWEVLRAGAQLEITGTTEWLETLSPIAYLIFRGQELEKSWEQVHTVRWLGPMNRSVWLEKLSLYLMFQEQELEKPWEQIHTVRWLGPMNRSVWLEKLSLYLMFQEQELEKPWEQVHNVRWLGPMNRSVWLEKLSLYLMFQEQELEKPWEQVHNVRWLGPMNTSIC